MEEVCDIYTIDNDDYILLDSIIYEQEKYLLLSKKDDDGMNKESEIIDELIEDERHDCETQPEKTEWWAGEKPPVGVCL